MTGNPETFRPTDLERAMLEHLLSKGYSKSQVIRLGIKLVYLMDEKTQKNMLTEPEKMMIGRVEDGRITDLKVVGNHPDWAAEIDR